MKRLALYLSMSIFITCSAPAFAEDGDIKDPQAVISEINSDLEGQQALKAFDAIVRYIHATATPEANVQLSTLKAAIEQIVSTGHANIVDKLYERQFGNSVLLSMYYFNFPKNTNNNLPAYAFVRYTFTRGSDGWRMANIDFKTSAAFPPAGWVLP